MKIAVDWPSPEKLVSNEIMTLEKIGEDPKFCEKQGELAASAYNCCLYYKNRDIKRTGFSFSSWIEFPRSPIVKKASIECLITIDSSRTSTYGMLTYSFGLFKPTEHDKLHLIKKYHVDFIGLPKSDTYPLQPIFHLQSPGELSPMLKEHGITDDHLEPALSEPRLCCAPITLALLTDLLLREFGGDDISHLTKITKDPYWRGLIKRDEELVLKPYFRACSKFFEDRKNEHRPEREQLFTQDFVYGQN